MTALDVNVDDLEVGRIVTAMTAIGRHPAIVLSTQEEADETGEVFVVPISGNNTISLKEDLINVPSRLGMNKTCYVQCGNAEVIPISNVERVWTRKAWGPFLLDVQTKVQQAIDRKNKSVSQAKKSTRN